MSSPWDILGRHLYCAVREQIREQGEASVSPTVRYLMRQIATELDASLRLEAIHDGGEMIIVEVGRWGFEGALFGTLPCRRLVVLQHEAPDVLADLERRRRLAGWFGNVPAVIADLADQSEA